MTQALLHKRMHLAALAALLALVAALFAALPSASAQAACASGNIALTNTTTSCTITTTNATAASSSSTDVVTVTHAGTVTTLTAVGNGSAVISITVSTPDPGRGPPTISTVTRNVTVTGFTAPPAGGGSTAATTSQTGMTLKLDDSDSIVESGSDYRVDVTVRAPALATAAERGYAFSHVRLSGGLLGGCEGDVPITTAGCKDFRFAMASGVNTATVTSPRPNTPTGLRFIVIRIPAGTPKGDYVLSARVVRLNGHIRTGSGSATGVLFVNNRPAEAYDAQLKFTVTDGAGTGRNVGSATLSLARTVRSTAAGHVDGMRHARSVDANSMPETATAVAGKSIFLNAMVKNSLGNPANGRGRISGMTISAPGGVVQLHNSFGTMISGVSGNSALTLPQTVSSTTYTAEASNNFSVKRTAPGTVDVSVTAIAADGIARTETIKLTFTGPATKLSLTPRENALLNHYKDRDTDGSGTDTDTDRRDDLSLTLAATDKGGNAVAPGTGGARTITDPDGNPVEPSKLTSSTAVSGGATVVSVAVASGVSAASPLKSGEYTITVANSATVKASAKFMVVGLANSVALEADEQMPSKIGQVVTVTATVTDSDGKNVADGTMVSFAAAGARAGVPVATRIGSTGNVATRNGKASAKFVVATSGAGVITAVADNASNTLVLTSTAGQAPAAEEPEEVRDSAGLSSTQLNSFSSWTASNDTTAAELFRSLAGRGATSLQLWNGSRWLRYSVVNGAMVPGSVDFTVMTGDVLYIGG